MTRKPIANPQEKGIALIVIAGLLVVLLLFSGLAIDLGRAYVVKAQLTKAVDGAALAAARALSSTGTRDRDEAIRIFQANFPSGYLGTSMVTNPATDLNFFTKIYDQASGANIITIQAKAKLPVTFMRLGGFDQITIGGMGEARRRLVDLSLAIDCSSSLVADWTTVQAAATRFIGSFDSNHDRMAVTLFSDGAHVSYAMPPTNGFNLSSATSAVPTSLPGGSTSTAEGFYRAWDELSSVPSGSQSGLRVIVLFTDGVPNGIPGNFQFNGSPYSKELNTNSFPAVGTEGTDTPSLFGLADPDNSGTPPHTLYNPAMGSGGVYTPTGAWNSPISYTSPQVPWLPNPAKSFHAIHRPGTTIPDSFDLFSTSLYVNGVKQNIARDLRNPTGGQYPADIHNVNNAARNLLEIIADAARSDSHGDYPIRVYTIGMGDWLDYLMGTIPEKGSDILKRIANDKTSTDYNSAQLAGKYFFAPSAVDVDPAFQALRSEIVRLSK